MPDKIVNHFVLADGSTAKYSAEQLAGDVPEVADIRVGADGVTYPNAGDAVRGQINELKNDLNDLNTNTNASFEPGRYNITANRVVKTDTTNKLRAEINVEPGCVYRVTFCSYGTSSDVIIFADKYGNVISSIKGESSRTNTTVTVVAPENSATLYVTHDTYSQTANTPKIVTITNNATVNNAKMSSDILIAYLNARTKKESVVVSTSYNAQITATGKIQSQSGTSKHVNVYPVTMGNTYILYGEDALISTNTPIAAYNTQLFNGTDPIDESTILIAGQSDVATDYNITFSPNENGYVYIATYGSYPQVKVYDSHYSSEIIDDIIEDVNTTNDSIITRASLLSQNTAFAPKDLYNDYKSTFIDDFTARESFVDANHSYGISGNDTGVNRPTITTGVGATRTGTSEMSVLWYSRQITRLPYCAVIGKVPDAQQNIRFYGTESISISGTQGTVVYQANTIGRLHVNTRYHIVFIKENEIDIFDDTGVSVTIPIAYAYSKPLTIEIGFGINENRLFGYSSFIEMSKCRLVDLNFDRCVKENESGEPYDKLKSLTSFTHSTESTGSTTTYDPTQSANHEIRQSGISNRLCYASIIDYANDTGYRTETKIVSVNSDLTNKNGGLQRFHFDADFRMNSADNPTAAYNTYIFQLHDAGFELEGWVDAPPLAIRVRNNKLYAMINYIDNGAIPESDNRHTTDEYELCDFSQDEWHHITIDARIGWKTGLLPKLSVSFDGIERLELDTPIGFNIVSSGGYVVTQFGVYCPELKGGHYPNAHREVLYTNINWKGEIESFN